MLIADADAHLTAVATVWAAIFSGFTLIVAVLAVFFGARAAQSANKTFRLESEPRIIVRSPSKSRIMWSSVERCFVGLRSRVARGVGPTAPDDVESLGDDPIFLIMAKPDREGNLVVAAGLQLTPAGKFPQPLGTLETTRDVYPALRIEVRNLGRSPAVQIRIPWKLSALGTQRGLSEETLVESTVYEGDATIVMDGVGPNDSTAIWIANCLGLQVTLTVGSPGTRVDPENLKSGYKEIALLSSTFRLDPYYVAHR